MAVMNDGRYPDVKDVGGYREEGTFTLRITKLGSIPEKKEAPLQQRTIQEIKHLSVTNPSYFNVWNHAVVHHCRKVTSKTSRGWTMIR